MKGVDTPPHTWLSRSGPPSTDVGLAEGVPAVFGRLPLGLLDDVDGRDISDQASRYRVFAKENGIYNILEYHNIIYDHMMARSAKYLGSHTPSGESDLICLGNWSCWWVSDHPSEWPIIVKGCKGKWTIAGSLKGIEI